MRQLIIILLPFFLFACKTEQKEEKEGLEERFQTTMGRAQGTSYRIKYASEDTLEGFASKVDSLLRSVDSSFSMYVDSSGVLDFARSKDGSCMDTEFKKLYRIARELYDRTDGAFDPTIGPLVDAWGFGAEGGPQGPPDSLDRLKEHVGMDRLSVDTNVRNEGDTCFFLRKKSPEMSFDPNAIAQGYAVDLIAQMAREQFDIERAMIQLGGEVRTLGRKAKKEPWRIGVEKPTGPDEDRSLNAIAELEDLSMATSGSYRKFYEKDGERYPHVIDPRTGKPVQHQLLSVTVTHPSCTYADAYATAFMIMGSDKASTFVKEHEDLEAYFIMADGSDDYKTFATEGMKAILKKN